jgi:hypothetical protein
MRSFKPSQTENQQTPQYWLAICEEPNESTKDIVVRKKEDQPAGSEPKGSGAAPAAKPRSRWRFFRRAVLVLIILLIVGRLAMPRAIRWYVNRTLDQSTIYQGKIGEVEVHLYRGAYSIRNVRIVKMTGNVPVPLFAADRVEFAVQWNALLHRRIVGRMSIEKPELNFVDAPNSADSQTGAGGPWLKIIRDLFPFKINSAQVHDGSIHFRTFESERPVDVYLSDLQASIDNLTNISNEVTPLLTTVDAKAVAMNDAKFEYKMKLDPFSYRPTFHLTVRLIGLDVTKINDLALAYGKFDFKKGWFDLVLEVDAKEGRIAGYVKPLFRNLVVFSLIKDVKEDNPLQFFWQALVGAATQLLKNQPRDQFGTLIPFTGDEATSKPDILATIGNVLRNAFVRAYLPKLENGPPDTGLQFDPPQVSDPISAGDPP